MYDKKTILRQKPIFQANNCCKPNYFLTQKPILGQKLLYAKLFFTPKHFYVKNSRLYHIFYHVFRKIGVEKGKNFSVKIIVVAFCI